MSKVKAESKTAVTEEVFGKARTKCAELVNRIAQFEDALRELKSRLKFLERRNNVAGFRFSMRVDECDFLKR